MKMKESIILYTHNYIEYLTEEEKKALNILKNIFHWFTYELREERLALSFYKGDIQKISIEKEGKTILYKHPWPTTRPEEII